MSPTLDISATQLSSAVKIILNWGSSLGSLEVIKYLIVTNEVSKSTQFAETPFNSRDFDDFPISSLQLDQTILPLGKRTILMVRALLSDGSYVSSNVLTVRNISQPAKPELSISHLRSEDQGVSINLGALYSENSLSEGYSELKKIIVFISKILTDNTTLPNFQVRTLTVQTNSAESGKGKYDSWVPVGAFDLENNSEYEMAVKVTNDAGESLLSSNPVSFSPKDTPSQIDRPLARALLTDQLIKNESLSDSDGTAVVYWAKPADFDNLVTNKRPVTRYVIREQEMIRNPVSNNLEASGSPIEIELVVPPSGKPSFELDTPYAYAVSGQSSNNYHYRHLIAGSPSRIGKMFTYSVFASNLNGDGPISNVQLENSFVSPLILPSQQDFEISHTQTTVQSTTPLNIFSGEISLKIPSLSLTNGGKDEKVDNSSFAPNNGYNRVLKLIIKKHSDNSEIYNSDVTFIQKINTVITGTGVNQKTTYEETGNFEFVLGNLDNLLDLGTKYIFNLQRKTSDPAFVGRNFYSLAKTIIRTKFKSSDGITKVQAFAVNDDLSLVKTALGFPGLRISFEQLATSQMGGLEVFGAAKEYELFRSSLKVANMDPLVHDSNVVERNFIIEATVGQQNNYYIRVKLFNPELNSWIDGLESTPVVSETAFNYPPAPSSINITKLSSTSVSISYPKQIVSLTGNGSGSDVYNRVLVVDSKSNIILNVLSDPHNTLPANPSVTVTGLIPGESHAAFIVCERKYSKKGLDNSSSNLKYDNVTLRSNYITKNFVANGQPTSIINLELFPKSDSLDVLWDLPPSTNLNGVLESSLRSHFYISKDPTDFPKASTGAFVYPSIMDVAGATSVTLNKGFQSKASATSREAAQALEKYIPLYFTTRLIGSVGGTTLSLSYTHNENSGKVNGNTVSSMLKLDALNTVPLETVEGDFSTVQTFTLSDPVPMPQNVEVLAEAEKLSVRWTKDTTISDFMVVVDDNDGGITQFDTRLARTTNNFTGQFNLDSAFTNSTLPPLFNSTGFDFKKVNNSTYQMTFKGLTNGKVYNLSVKNIVYLGADYFSEAVNVSRAPEAPPTAVQNITFSVDSNVINLAWAAPSNLGGASVGSNSGIKYRVTVNKVENNGSLTQVGSNIDVTTLSTVISGLTNATNYSISIAAFYIKGSDSSIVIGPPTPANSNTMLVNSISHNVIRPNTAPVGSVLSASAMTGGVVTPNTIFANVLTAAAAEQSLYPLSSIQVWVRPKSNPTQQQLVFTHTGPFSGSNTLQRTINSFSPALNGMTRPLNGLEHQVVIKHIPNYTYAQPPSDKVVDVTPMGTLTIFNAASTFAGVAVDAPKVVTGSAGKVMRIWVNRAGSGNIRSIVGIAKTGSSNTIVVSNLSDVNSNLPTITNQGSVSDADGVGAGQVASFDLSFTALPSAVSDLLTVVVSDNGSDALASPGTFFN